jgi:hypothetical protein
VTDSQDKVDEVCLIGSDKKCQVDTMRKYHAKGSTTSKTVQGKQCGKMDKLFHTNAPQQYKDKSTTGFLDQQDQELSYIDLVPRTKLAEANKEVDRASMRGHIQSTLNVTDQHVPIDQAMGDVAVKVTNPTTRA